jgi:hypothetical protein
MLLGLKLVLFIFISKLHFPVPGLISFAENIWVSISLHITQVDYVLRLHQFLKSDMIIPAHDILCLGPGADATYAALVQNKML